MSALGQKQTYASQQVMSALPPNSDRKSGLPQRDMSALHPIADMCVAIADVCFGPIADIPLFDHFVGDLLKLARHIQAERLGGLQVDDQLELG